MYLRNDGAARCHKPEDTNPPSMTANEYHNHFRCPSQVMSVQHAEEQEIRQQCHTETS